MNVAVLSARCDRSLVIVGMTEAYHEALKAIRDAVASSPDPLTTKVLLALADRLVEKTQVAAAEASALSVLTRAEASAREAQT